MSNPSQNKGWTEEARAVIKDIQPHVQKISISDLPCSRKKIFFNMTTLENKDFCVELTQEGFRIVGEEYNSDAKRGKYGTFETPYSMLDCLSPAYRDSFREELCEKLDKLRRERENAEKEEEGAKE